MKVIKVGGKSLAKGNGNITEILKSKAEKEKIVVVVSAFGDTTDTLSTILEAAKKQNGYKDLFDEFMERPYHVDIDLSNEFEDLRKLFEGVSLLGEYNLKIKDIVLAYGELISVKILTDHLRKAGLQPKEVDSREFFRANSKFGRALVEEEISRGKTRNHFAGLAKNEIPVVTGFIAKTADGDTVTLGRNGSNYSAALLADFLDAGELQNYTHVDGIFSANPDWVRSAHQLRDLHFDEANELATFGTSVLHAKTILPLLEKEIPLRILNTLNLDNEGTLISGKKTNSGIKSLSVQSDLALIQLEGHGLLGKVGVDGRIFGTMAKANISVGVISQGSSERGIGFVVPQDDAQVAKAALEEEFATDIKHRDVDEISVRSNLTVISIIGLRLTEFDKAYASLIKNKITPILFNNAITGKNVSLLIDEKQAKKAANVIHGQIFGVSKTVNLAIFGHGLVGGTLIDQILESTASIESRKKVRFNIFAVGNSRKVLLDRDGVSKDWEARLGKEGQAYQIDDIIRFADKNHLENLIAVDNTASETFVDNYIPLVKNGFDLVSSNKIGNTVTYGFYGELRKNLESNQKEYLYETNVGAGLPLIDTIKLLHISGENITRIKGVFSGSLSYIFNTFSEGNKAFDEVLREADTKGFTEPDPREDLSGNDVARKLLILARELDLENELSEVEIQNLIPKEFQAMDTNEFLDNLVKLNPCFEAYKSELGQGSVLRYVGELSGDLQGKKGELETKLVQAPKNSPLGQLTGSDTIFEIYTENYGDNPLIIQGAGAGAAVTARGVFGDILRLADK